MPKGMNWDRVNKENRIRRYGTAPGNDEQPFTGSQADQRRQEHACLILSTKDRKNKLFNQLKTIINKTTTKKFLYDKEYQIKLLNELEKIYKKVKVFNINRYQERYLREAEELISLKKIKVEVKLRKKFRNPSN